MKKGIIILFIIFTSLSHAQITIIGHNMINYTAIKNTKITVVSEGVITQTLNTLSRPDFKLQLGFGKNYSIYFQNSRSPVMFMEVAGNTVPKDKYAYMMTYEMNVPFADKADTDIDTTVFSKPFHRVLYNGSTKMVEDTVYNNAFNKTILKKTPADATVTDYIKNDRPVLLAGKIVPSPGAPVILENKIINLIDKSGKIIKSSTVNRFGIFTFGAVKFSQAHLIRLENADSLKQSHLQLLSSKNQKITAGALVQHHYEWVNESENFQWLIDNNFTSNIGGKLVASSAREKKFFAEKNIYLLNKMHTVLQKARTNLFGTFVFEGVKPENVYYIAVDKSEIGAGEHIDLLNKEDRFISALDTIAAGKLAYRVTTNNNKKFRDLSIGEDEMKMDVKATIFGDNVNNPIGKLKIVLLNDNYEVMDSAITDNFGAFKFKYLPFLKRFYLSAENTDNVLDVFKNILIYSSDDNLIKIMTHQKGKKFTYAPVNSEMTVMRGIELEDPWLELIEEKEVIKDNSTATIYPKDKKTGKGPSKLIVENILFENNKSEITPQAREVLDKVILVLNHNTGLKIEVGAHTDSKGSALANLKLSELRAKMVKSYITQGGINGARILAKGYGETQLINDCTDAKPCTEEEHAKNRRIEFKILGEQQIKQ